MPIQMKQRGDLATLCLVCRYLKGLVTPILYNFFEIKYGAVVNTTVADCMLLSDHPGIRFIKHLSIVHELDNEEEESQPSTLLMRDSLLRAMIGRIKEGQLVSLRHVI